MYYLFILGEFLTALARWPNLRDVTVSASLYKDGEILTIRLVKAFPPKLSWSNRVNFESLYGMWFFPSLRAWITLPKADKLVLILIASFSCLPSVPVFDIFSLPARSITVSLALFAYPLAKSFWTKVIMKSIWDLEERAFIWVNPTDLFSRPSWSSSYPYSACDMYLSVTCSMKTPLFLFWRSFKLRRVRSSKSVTF